MRVVISTMNPGSFGQSETDMFHPNMIHLLRKEEDGKNRLRDKETVPDIHHWQLQLEVKIEKQFLNLYVRNKTGEKDRERMKEIKDLDYLFSIGPDRRLELGKEKKKLHLQILHPKSEERANKDEVSLDKIVEDRIQSDLRNEIKKRFNKKNSINLKKVQLKCEVFDLSTNALIGCEISGVIKDKANKVFGSLEMKEVRPLLSCELGGRSILVVTEHPIKKGSVLPVLQLFDSQGNRLEDDEKNFITQPEVLEGDGDDRMLKFWAPKQDHFSVWKHGWELKLKLRRKDEKDKSESISSTTFQYKRHESCLIEEPPGGGELVCLYCHPGVLDGAQTHLSSLPVHCGPGLKRRRVSSPAVNRSQAVLSTREIQTAQQALVAQQAVDSPHSDYIMDEVEMLGNENQVAPVTVFHLTQPPALDVWQKLGEEERRNSELNTPDMEDVAPFFTSDRQQSLNVIPPVSESLPDEIFHDGANPRQRLVDMEEEAGTVRLSPPGRDGGLTWWLVLALFGDDQEARQVFRTGDVPLRGMLRVVLRNYPLLPVVLFALITVSFIVPVSSGNLMAIVVALISALVLICYQNTR